MNTDIPNPLKVSVFNVFMSIRAHLFVCLKTAVFSPVWRKNGHRKHTFLKSLQSRYFEKTVFAVLVGMDENGSFYKRLRYGVAWPASKTWFTRYVDLLAMQARYCFRAEKRNEHAWTF